VFWTQICLDVMVMIQYKN